MCDESFLSVLRPGAAISKNTVSALHKDVGRAFTRIVRFMRRRAEAIGADASVLLDGTLKSNESKVDSLSDFSRKAKTKGTRDISVLYAFDLDLDPGKVYKMYEERWEIEIVMRYYKSACEFDETRMHGDYSVVGSEFCDFLASVLTFRLIKAFDKAGLLKTMNYSRIMSLLKRAKKVRVGEDGDWRLVKVNPKLEKMLAALGLAPTADEWVDVASFDEYSELLSCYLWDQN